MSYKRFRIFFFSLALTAVIMAAKMVLHFFDYELLTMGSLHSSVITGTFFVIGFLLSTTIADYKEGERIPSEFSSILENMYEDARAFHKNYPEFDLGIFRQRLQKVARLFASDVRNKKHTTRLAVHELGSSLEEMERAKVPANYIVKLKQQQAQLGKLLFRVTYIQRITFIPSATILARCIVPLAIGLLVFTKIDPLIGGMAITAIICFILIYILKLIEVISTPFQSEGKTQDDVSLFLVDETVSHLKK